MKMRALTIQQPFAFGIVNGLKRVENRSWTVKYRGPVAIHASLNRERIEVLKQEIGPSFDAALFPLGVVVGVAELVDIVPLGPDIEHEPTAEGPLCWIFENPRILAEPVPAKGKTSLFYLSEEESAAVAKQLENPIPSDAEVVENLKQFLIPDPYDLNLDRAAIYFEQSEFENAERCINQALALDDSMEHVWRKRAVLRTMQGKLTEAMADIEKCIAMEPGEAWCYIGRSDIWADMGEHEKAEADRQYAIELNPEIADFLAQVKEEDQASPDIDAT